MNFDAAIAYLADHTNLEATGSPGRHRPPTLDRMREAMDLLAHPETQFPMIHVTGTNGKTSTARIAVRLLMSTGLRVGSFTSPDLQHITERMAADLVPISLSDFGDAIGAIADLDSMMSAPLSRFEVLTAAAYAWFADLPAHAAVVEVGLLGRWDATNVADGQVAVVTNVGADHLDYVSSIREVAEEKAGIVKPGAILVLGETEEELCAPFEHTDAAEVWRRGEHFGVGDSQIAVGGRLLTIYTPGASYEDLFLPLHGEFQAENAACAVAATEAFVGQPLDGELIGEALAAVTSPGRCEVVDYGPLVVIDGAHNPGGAAGLGDTLRSEFDVPGRWIVVLGALTPHDAHAFLEALEPPAGTLVIASEPDWPRAIPVSQLTAAARSLGFAAEVASTPSTASAIELARSLAADDDLIVVTGSLYTVGEARTAILGRG